jgi:DNA-binding MarR family transcriptional regulator
MTRVGSVSKEIQQGKGFRSHQEEAIVVLLRTADVVRRLLAEVVEPLGITLQQYNVLRILRGASDQGMPTLEIAARMIEQAPGITRLLDRLEARSLVRRQRCTGDRRQVLCSITPSGLKLLGRLDAPVAAADRQILVGLAPAELTSFIKLMDKVRAAHSRGKD